MKIVPLPVTGRAYRCWDVFTGRRLLRCSVAGSGAVLQPGVAFGVPSCVVGIEIDEDSLDLPVTDLEHVAPPAGPPLRHAGSPRAILVLPVAGTFAHDYVAAGKHPVDVRVVVLDVLDRAAHVGEQLADLFLTGRQAPFGEVHLSVVGEQVR